MSNLSLIPLGTVVDKLCISVDEVLGLHVSGELTINSYSGIGTPMYSEEEVNAYIKAPFIPTSNTDFLGVGTLYSEVSSKTDVNSADLPRPIVSFTYETKDVDTALEITDLFPWLEAKAGNNNLVIEFLFAGLVESAIALKQKEYNMGQQEIQFLINLGYKSEEFDINNPYSTHVEFPIDDQLVHPSL